MPETLDRHDLVVGHRQFHLYGRPPVEPSRYPVVEPPHDLELRHDLATGAWIAISPRRNVRPGGDVAVGIGPEPVEASCPLCPGGPELPEPYDAAVFDNRFPAFSPVADGPFGDDRVPSSGRCEVVVYASRHAGSVATLAPAEIARTVAIWRDRCRELWSAGHGYVMAFENRGVEVGATISHPHGQIYAIDHVPPFVTLKLAALEAHRRAHHECLGCALAARDADPRREVQPNTSLTVAVPFAARWPYEVHLRARRHGCRRLSDLTAAEAADLARAVREVVQRYDALFGFELPYMMVVQEAPRGADDWHLHVEFLPPHRAAQRLKVRASVETALGLFINDTLPEDSARQLAGVTVESADPREFAVPDVAVAVAP